MQRAIELIAEERILAAFREGKFAIRLGPDVPLVLPGSEDQWLVERVAREDPELARRWLQGMDRPQAGLGNCE